jgi:predicted dehydrogenase
LRVAVVGARRERQGTGEFIARSFAQHGCSVEAIAGTSEASAEKARGALRDRYAIDCRAYVSLDELLRKEKPDVVAVASPAEFHRAALEAALRAGCHVFCEKPLFWSDAYDGDDSEELVRDDAGRLHELAHGRGRLLFLNTQWPETLDAFRELHPDALDQPLRSLDMWMSPLSEGTTMVVDSAPHVLSLVHALAGEGDVEPGRFDASRWPHGLDLEFDFRHAKGVARVGLHLRQCPEPPRPAAYAVNGRRADRVVELPSYRQSFESTGRRVELADPLERRVKRFIDAVGRGEPTDRYAIVEAMAQLARLVSVVSA